jgi:hypothetical protein
VEVMDGHGEQSQSRRTSIKRPWENETALPKQNATNFEMTRVAGSGGIHAYTGATMHSPFLPPIDAAPNRRPSILRNNERESANNHGLDLRESGVKRSKHEIRDRNTFPRQSFSAKFPPPREGSTWNRTF